MASARPVTRLRAPGPGRRHHHSRLARGAGIALGSEDPPLLVPRQDRADPVAIARQRLVQRHAGTARVGEDDLDSMTRQRLDQHVGPGDRPGSGPARRLQVINGGHSSSSLERPNRGSWNRFPSRRRRTWNCTTSVQRATIDPDTAMGPGFADDLRSAIRHPHPPGTTSPMPRTIRGGHAVVTGASSGLGRELVHQLVRDREMTVLATARRLDRLESLAAELPHGACLDDGRRPRGCEFPPGPVGARRGTPGRRRPARQQRGRWSLCRFRRSGPERIRQIIELNLMSLIDLSQMAVRHMRARGAGQILQISSVLGFVGIAESAVYAASKHAVNGLVKSLRYELAGTGVRVWAACPGRTMSEFSEMAGRGAAKPPSWPGTGTDRAGRPGDRPGAGQSSSVHLADLASPDGRRRGVLVPRPGRLVDHPARPRGVPRPGRHPDIGSLTERRKWVPFPWALSLAMRASASAFCG